MIRATAILPAGSWSEAAADTVLLDFEARHRRRVAVSGKGGTAFLLDLAGPGPLRHGDGLLLEDGRIIVVEAAAEPLAELSAPDPEALARLAWFLGSRQVPAVILQAGLRIRRDAALEEALSERGARIDPTVGPFDPDEAASRPQGPGGPSHAQGFAYSHGFHRHAGSSGPGGGAFAQSSGGARSFGEAHASSRSDGHAAAPGPHRGKPERPVDGRASESGGREAE